MAGADVRPKCPVCMSRVGDAAARDPGARVLVTYVPNPLYSNPKNAAQAAAIRRQNEGKGK